MAADELSVNGGEDLPEPAVGLAASVIVGAERVHVPELVGPVVRREDLEDSAVGVSREGDGGSRSVGPIVDAKPEAVGAAVAVGLGNGDD